MASLAGLCGLAVTIVLGVLGCQQLDYVGTNTCLTCHNGKLASDKREYLENVGHAPFEKGCEECHGPGSLHVANGGRYGLFMNRPGVDNCNKCHPAEVSGFNDSIHVKKSALRCFDCHNPHSKDKTVRPFTDNQLCLRCHANLSFDTEAQITAHTFHTYDPTGTGASRCVRCHMVPGQREDQDAGLHFHSLKAVQPKESNLAGITPAPPNSCAGITGCHDGTVPGAPVYDVDIPAINDYLQALFDTRYGS